MVDAQLLIRWALEAGFSQAAFCAPEDFLDAQRIVESQLPLAERRQLHFSPREDFPQVRSLAVLLWAYPPAKHAQDDTVFVDSYYAASNAAYHAARKLENKLLDAGTFAKANVSYPAKEAAVRAGLGTIGRHSLLITPQYGTRIVIILIATDIDCPQTENRAVHADACMQCSRCYAACPAGAIGERGMEHPERCLRNFMLEGTVVPQQLRSKIGMRMVGCDMCQRVCPMQPKAQDNTAVQRYTLHSFMTDDPAKFSSAVASLADEIGRNTARPQRIRAQVALLAGNSRNPAYLPVLRSWAQSPFEAVSAHAQWAIEQIELEANRT